MTKLSTSSLILLLALTTSVCAVQLQAAEADDFGRLFSNSNERQKLDVLRQNQQLKVIAPQDDMPEETTETTQPELTGPVTLQGYVKRSDGAATVWINNQAVQENSRVDGIEVGRLHGQSGAAQAGSDNLDVKIPASGKNIHLKAGQVYVPETNQIKELRVLEKEKRLRLEKTGVVDGDEKSIQ